MDLERKWKLGSQGKALLMTMVSKQRFSGISICNIQFPLAQQEKEQLLTWIKILMNLRQKKQKQQREEHECLTLNKIVKQLWGASSNPGDRIFFYTWSQFFLSPKNFGLQNDNPERYYHFSDVSSSDGPSQDSTDSEDLAGNWDAYLDIIQV